MSRKLKRVVVKIGSSVIAAHRTKPGESHLSALIDQIGFLHKEGKEFILVSSGAIVLGMNELDQEVRPSDLASLQACAAVGQNVLMRTYGDLLGQYHIKCAQLLLTWDDFKNHTRYDNAHHTLKAILNKGVIPIINENDTISTEEIKFGDNDKLSALVAKLIHADSLVILTDEKGLYRIEDGKKVFFDKVDEVTKEIESLATDTTKKNTSKGGMITKLEAVKIATASGIPCVIASSSVADVLTGVVLHGEQVGTYFPAKSKT